MKNIPINNSNGNQHIDKGLIIEMFAFDTIGERYCYK